MFVISLIFILIFCWWLLKRSGKSKKYKFPRGPKGLPIFGNIFQVMVQPHKKFSKWASQYGKIYTVSIMGRKAVVVNEVQTMKQVFGTSESTGRFEFEIHDVMYSGAFGLANTEGTVWSELRRFTIRALRECGFLRSSVVEPIVIQECDKFISWLESQPNCVAYPVRKQSIEMFSNISWNIFSQESSLSENQNVGKLIVDLFVGVQMTANRGLVFLPWLKYIFPEWSGYNKLAKATLNMQKHVETCFHERKLERQHANGAIECKNLIDAYIEQWKNCNDPKSAFYGETGWKHCLATMMSLIVAAGETTAATLNWVINYLIAYPEVQEKLHREIWENIRTDKNPSISDKARFPYLEAVVLEALRMSSFVPLGVMHKLLDDVNYDDYLLPKNTFLIANIYHANYNKSVWKDPETFRPERFLEVEISEKNQLKECIATFQPGKRVCPGEYLAKDELFLTVAKLVQKFEFHPVSGRRRDEYNHPDEGYVLMPKQIGVVAKSRITAS